jgi:hypothetical protein
MDEVSEIVGCDAQIDAVLSSAGGCAPVALLEAYRIAKNREAFVAALAAKLVMSRRLALEAQKANGR